MAEKTMRGSNISPVAADFVYEEMDINLSNGEKLDTPHLLEGMDIEFDDELLEWADTVLEPTQISAYGNGKLLSLNDQPAMACAGTSSKSHHSPPARQHTIAALRKMLIGVKQPVESLQLRPLGVSSTLATPTSFTETKKGGDMHDPPALPIPALTLESPFWERARSQLYPDKSYEQFTAMLWKLGKPSPEDRVLEDEDIVNLSLDIIEKEVECCEPPTKNDGPPVKKQTMYLLRKKVAPNGYFPDVQHGKPRRREDTTTSLTKTMEDDDVDDLPALPDPALMISNSISCHQGEQVTEMITDMMDQKGSISDGTEMTSELDSSSLDRQTPSAQPTPALPANTELQKDMLLAVLMNLKEDKDKKGEILTLQEIQMYLAALSQSGGGQMLFAFESQAGGDQMVSPFESQAGRDQMVSPFVSQAGGDQQPIV